MAAASGWQRLSRGPLASLAVVFLPWCVAVALVGPSGNFPLSDDWAYAHLVRSVCEGRGYDPLPWTGATAVVQVLYGTLACLLGGFSHEMLRWTTLAVSAAGITAFHALLREVGADARAAAGGAAVLALSPLWFSQSFTFMTDVPFASLAIVASWLYVRAFRVQTPSAFLAAGAACAAAFFVRQHAIAIALAAGLAVLLESRGRVRLSDPESRTRPRLFVAAVALPGAALIAYAIWAMTAEVPLAVRNKAGEALAASPLAMADVAFRALATLGFLYVPWAMAAAPRRRRLLAAVLALLLVPAALVWLREGDTMFYLGNVLGDFHIGALTTRDTLFLAKPLAPAGSVLLHGILTVVSLASAAALLARLAEDQSRTRGAALFLALALVFSALITLVQARYYFDRYVLVLLPLAIAAVCAAGPTLRFGAGATAAWAALAVYAVAGTHDYMAWNRARWSLLEAAEASGATARTIDGGVEYNATRLAAELGTAPTDAEAKSGQPASAKSWWWVVDDEWIVAFVPLDGYSEADSKTFTRWLPPMRQQVLLLHRN